MLSGERHSGVSSMAFGHCAVCLGRTWYFRLSTSSSPPF